jgi:hypothetical protein
MDNDISRGSVCIGAGVVCIRSGGAGISGQGACISGGRVCIGFGPRGYFFGFLRVITGVRSETGVMLTPAGLWSRCEAGARPSRVKGKE